MADRLKGLRRIKAVQTQMVRLAEWRLAVSERTCAEHLEDQTLLREYIARDGALGAPLARAALSSTKTIERRLAIAERERTSHKQRLEGLRRRERAVGAMVEEEAVFARRVAEDRDLAATIEAWLAGNGTSLP